MRIVIVLACIVLLTACGGKKPDDQAFEQSLDSANSAATTGADDELIEGILMQIPSPLEISVLLKEAGRKYDASILNTPDNLPKYNNNYKMALNLGVYGTDLGYANIYQQNQEGIRFLEPIEALAEGLNIGQFFDVETIGRLAANSKNLDSLLMLTTQNFNSINHYLQTQSRANLSVLLLVGGWVEAMQITTQLAAKDPGNKLLQDTIGEQKIILEQIILLLGLFPDDENMASLLNDMKSLLVAYDKVMITYTYKESTVDVVNGVAVIKDNSTTSITITPEDINNIRSVTSTIRTKIIS